VEWLEDFADDDDDSAEAKPLVYEHAAAVKKLNK